ncbi:MAG: hypothetical protein ACXACA_08455, partial [Candidatus Ranarchaeia archaeon]
MVQDDTWNAFMLLIETWIFSFAMTFFDFAIIVPAFISTITTSSLIMGLLFTVQNICAYLPQLLAAKYLTTTKIKKNFLFYNWFLGKLPLGVFSLILILFGLTNPPLILLLFFLTIVPFWISEGMGGVTWLDIVGKVIPSNKRGQFFGLTSVGGGLLAIGGGFIVNHIQNSRSYPSNYTTLFSVSFLLIMLSVIFVAFIREQPERVDADSKGLIDFLKRLPVMLKVNQAFRRLAITQVLINCIGLATPFYTLYAIQNLSLGYEVVGLLVLTQTLGRALSGFFITYIGNKWRTKTILQLGIGLILAVPLSILGLWFTSLYLHLVDPLIPYTVIFALRGASLSIFHTGAS